MKTTTILELNTINTTFYADVAQEFSDSREHFWRGWGELLPFLSELIKQQQSISVLDIGCGNGRFAQFLVKHFPKTTITYTGIDNNARLLEIAQQKVQAAHLKANFRHHDVVTELLAKTFLDDADRYDLIVSFGVVHHIPSFKLRQSFFQAIHKKLTKDGLAILTLWKFMDSTRLEKKLLSFESTQISPTELEANDYLVSWQRGKATYRYCHYTDNAEQQQLILHSGLHLIKTFEADGKEGRGNTYLVLNQTKSV